MIKNKTNKKVYIYCLFEYGTHVPRYVGQTSKSIEKRCYEHVRSAMRGHKSYRDSWIREVLKRGGLICTELRETVLPGNDWKEAEQRWIRGYRDMGCPLTNLTDGGEGIVGYVHTEESKKKSSRSHKEHFELHPETRDTMSLAQLERYRLHPESHGKLGEKDSIETVKKKSVSKLGKLNPMFKKPSNMRGKHPSAASNEKNRLSHLGQPSAMKNKHYSEEEKIAMKALRKERREKKILEALLWTSPEFLELVVGF